MAFPTTKQGFGPINQPIERDATNLYFNITKDEIEMAQTPPFSIYPDPEKHGVHAYYCSKNDLSIIQDFIYMAPDVEEPNNIAQELFEQWWYGPNNPAEGILDCFYLPNFSTTTSDPTPTARPTNVKIKNSEWVFLNGKRCARGADNAYSGLLTQYYWRNFGEMDIPKYFDSYLDYAPYTKIQVYLPFIGMQDIQVNLCMGGSISISYLINTFNGNCTAFITLKDAEGDKRVLNTATGNCAVHIPLTSYVDNRALNTINSVVKSATTLLTMLAGGAAAKAANVSTASTALQQAQRINAAASASQVIPFTNDYACTQGIAAYTVDQVSRNQMIYAAQLQAIAAQQGSPISGTMIGSAAGQALNSIGGALQTPTSATLIGNVAGDMAIMSQLAPYIVILRPVPCTPYNYNYYFGRPSNVTGSIRDFTGFNQFGAVNVQIDDVSDIERSEIKTILSAGVILPDEPRT